ncbi:MAG: hypothetical protein ACI4S9_02800 [Christensenellales bacterium]
MEEITYQIAEAVLLEVDGVEDIEYAAEEDGGFVAVMKDGKRLKITISSV